MFQILAATGNVHKLREFQKMLNEIDVEEEIKVLGPDDVGGIPDVVEDGETFESNAEKKALSASNAAGMVAFADDSGLMVDALGGAPGVQSARYGGPDAVTDADRVEKLLGDMKGIDNRSAKFVCVLAVANEGDVVGTFRGEVKGTIIGAPRGENGFGYDPIFVPDGFDRTFGEMTAEEKDSISHRAKAIEAAVDFFEDAMSIDI